MTVKAEQPPEIRLSPIAARVYEVLASDKFMVITKKEYAGLMQAIKNFQRAKSRES